MAHVPLFRMHMSCVHVYQDSVQCANSSSAHVRMQFVSVAAFSIIFAVPILYVFFAVFDVLAGSTD
jgi:hypothetical protein